MREESPVDGHLAGISYHIGLNPSSYRPNIDRGRWCKGMNLGFYLCCDLLLDLVQQFKHIIYGADTKPGDAGVGRSAFGFYIEPDHTFLCYGDPVVCLLTDNDEIRIDVVLIEYIFGSPAPGLLVAYEFENQSTPQIQVLSCNRYGGHGHRCHAGFSIRCTPTIHYAFNNLGA